MRQGVLKLHVHLFNLFVEIAEDCL